MSILELKSESQLVGAMARTVLANSGLNDLSPGSVLLTLIQAAASADFEQYYTMLQIIRNYNLDTTTNTDLDNRAMEFGLTRKQALAATGRVSILREDSFVKIASTFYTGFRSRISGDTQLFLNDASAFPTTGTAQTLVIGRGTPNEEEVTYTPSGSNPQNNINYFTITLDVPLSNDHALEESVVLKQGIDTAIPVGTVLQVPSSGKTAQVTFTTTVVVTILSGELQVDDVNVQCTVPGVVGNIGVNAITGVTAFVSAPFAGARASNGSAFSNGQNRETDTALRNRIKNFIQALSQSTKAGIANAIDGLVDASTAKRVVSNNIILPPSVGYPVKIFIDDGTGFEPSFSRQGYEVIVAEAIGGETRVPLDLFPLVKAQIETLSTEPFNMALSGLDLLVNVGNQSETIPFYTTDFVIPSAGTSEEIVKAINARSMLLEARTSEVGSRVVINAKADINEDIQVTGGTANSSTRLNFPTNLVKTFYLYKNDKLLSKDGATAYVDSAHAGICDFSAGPYTLTIIVDGKTANTQTATFLSTDFPTASAATIDQIAALINLQVAGLTAENANGKLRLVSNTKLAAKSKIQVTGGSANVELDFPTTQVVGSDQDYLLNPELGVVELVTPLSVNDLLTAGTRNTRAFLTASNPGDYTFGALTNGFIVTVDGGSVQNITLPNGTFSAAQVAAALNGLLVGATAVVRTIGAFDYLEIRSNTYNDSLGSIMIGAGSSNIALGFITSLTVYSIQPHVAYQTAVSSGPYAFVEGDTLVVVIDNNPTGKTFIITMNYGSTVTSGTSTTIFGASLFETVFLNNSDLPGFWVVMKSGANSTQSSLLKVENPGGNTYRYTFANPAPANYSDFTVGDQVTFSTMDQAGNNGSFLVTGRVTLGTALVAVESNSNSNPAALTPTVGQRFLVGVDAQTSAKPSVISRIIANPSATTPTLGDRYIVAVGANNVSLADVQSATIVDSALATPTHGFRYIINGVGVNLWAGHNYQIAQYNGVGTPGWVFITPADLDVAKSLADNKTYQFSTGTGTWVENAWGGSAGKVATGTGTAWTIAASTDKDVRSVTAESKLYQFSSSTNLWVKNAWGGSADKIATWSGTVWSFVSPTATDTLFINDLAQTYQYTGTGWVEFFYWVEVTNAAGTTESATAAGIGLLGQRRLITAYNAISGQITVAAPFRVIPTVLDTFIVLPGTRANIVTYFNNLKVTSLSTKAAIELVQQGSKVQISSLADGSDGYVQITGGKANTLLQFSNSLINGLQGYSYYTGLIKLVHSTIYGDEKDLVTFPGVGAAGIKFQILPPTVQEVGFSLEVTLAQGISLSAVENDIKTSVISYVNSLGIFSPVILSNIVERVLGVSGIIDVKITSPLTNIIVKENEIARTKASIITVNVA